MSSQNTVLYISGLTVGYRARDLASHFERYGRLVRCDIPAPPPNSRNPRTCFAFIEFEDSRDAQIAITEMDGRRIDGMGLRVEWAKNAPSRNWRFDGRNPPREPSLSPSALEHGQPLPLQPLPLQPSSSSSSHSSNYPPASSTAAGYHSAPYQHPPPRHHRYDKDEVYKGPPPRSHSTNPPPRRDYLPNERRNDFPVGLDGNSSEYNRSSAIIREREYRPSRQQDYHGQHPRSEGGYTRDRSPRGRTPPDYINRREYPPPHVAGSLSSNGHGEYGRDRGRREYRSKSRDYNNVPPLSSSIPPSHYHYQDRRSDPYRSGPRPPYEGRGQYEYRGGDSRSGPISSGRYEGRPSDRGSFRGGPGRMNNDRERVGGGAHGRSYGNNQPQSYGSHHTQSADGRDRREYGGDERRGRQGISENDVGYKQSNEFGESTRQPQSRQISPSHSYKSYPQNGNQENLNLGGVNGETSETWEAPTLAALGNVWKAPINPVDVDNGWTEVGVTSQSKSEEDQGKKGWVSSKASHGGDGEISLGGEVGEKFEMSSNVGVADE